MHWQRTTCAPYSTATVAGIQGANWDPEKAVYFCYKSLLNHQDMNVILSWPSNPQQVSIIGFSPAHFLALRPDPHVLFVRWFLKQKLEQPFFKMLVRILRDCGNAEERSGANWVRWVHTEALRVVDKVLDPRQVSKDAREQLKQIVQVTPQCLRDALKESIKHNAKQLRPQVDVMQCTELKLAYVRELPGITVSVESVLVYGGLPVVFLVLYLQAP